MSNSFFDFNPQSYKEPLSLFGRRVLDVMMSRWMEDLDRDKANNHQQKGRFRNNSSGVRNRRILTFNDDNNNNRHNNVPLAFSFNESYHNEHLTRPVDIMDQIEFESNEEESHIVPTSIELIKVFEKNKTGHISQYLRDNLLHTEYKHSNAEQKESQIKIKKSKDISHSYSNQDYNANTIDTTDIEISNKRDTLILNNNSINWNDMFDIDILPGDDMENNKVDPILYSPNNNKASKEINIISNEVITANNLKALIKKRKCQKKITDSAPKKVKQIPKETAKKPKVSLKKDTTKTVENWLENIDTCNAAEITTNSVDKKINGIDIFYSSKGTDRSKEKKGKKIIQAQLANKDGIMKFKTPNVKTNDFTKKESIVTEKIDNVSKDKKMKSKFIAPTKSQLPVKDVTFEIILLNSINIEKYLNISDKIHNNEIVLLLIYSNGFCQLNSQHTADTSDAEGLMIHCKNTFFYLKDFDFTDKMEIGNTLLKFLIDAIIICYEAKDLLIYLITKLNLKININQYQIIDTKIGGNLLDPDNPPENFSALHKLLSFTPDYTIASECVLQKTAWYVSLLKDCTDKLRSALTNHSLWNVFITIEMRLVPLIADMERQGVNVNLDKLKSMECLLHNKMKEVEQKCYKAAGKIFQINSTVQVRAILYDELKLDSKSNVKIRETVFTGAKSTSETMLRSLMPLHPLPKLILKYRHLHKAIATFVTGIAQHVRNGVVKPTWVQTAAATGRIASNNPNLQAIPKTPFSLDMFPDLDDTDNLQLNFRSVYVARPGFKLLAADFQHIECRVFAHAAADTSLLEILRGDGDLFKVLASKWLKKSEDEVSSEDRERTKRIVYASLYGAGTRKLMEILDVSYDQTLSIIASFNRTFPSLKSFGRSVVSKCEANDGRLFTLAGRARHFKNIMSQDFALKSHAERQAINFIVQGSAADLCKIAMVLTEDSLKSSIPPIEGHLVLQIHDELVWEIADAEVEKAADIIRNVMENCGHHCGMPLKLPVAISCGQNWGEMEKKISKAL